MYNLQHHWHLCSPGNSGAFSAIPWLEAAQYSSTSAKNPGALMAPMSSVCLPSRPSTALGRTCTLVFLELAIRNRPLSLPRISLLSLHHTSGQDALPAHACNRTLQDWKTPDSNKISCIHLSMWSNRTLSFCSIEFDHVSYSSILCGHDRSQADLSSEHGHFSDHQ